MRKWSFEVRHGMLSTLPNSLANCVKEQKAENAASFFVSEAGTLLNEPDQKTVGPIYLGTKVNDAIARMAEAVGWVFDRFEGELDQDVEHNYLKVSFVNLKSVHDSDIMTSGKMSTNSPELPETADVSPQMMLHQMTTAIRVFCLHVKAAVDNGGWEGDACDWVSMTLNKS